MIWYSVPVGSFTKGTGPDVDHLTVIEYLALTAEGVEVPLPTGARLHCLTGQTEGLLGCSAPLGPRRGADGRFLPACPSDWTLLDLEEAVAAFTLLMGRPPTSAEVF